MERCAADVTAIILCTVAGECTCMDCSSFIESYPVSNLMYVDYTNNYIRGMNSWGSKNSTPQPIILNVTGRWKGLKAMLQKHASNFGTQCYHYLSGVLWAYRNTPHEATCKAM